MTNSEKHLRQQQRGASHMTEWDDWLRNNVPKTGGQFKLIYDLWVSSEPVYSSMFRLLPPPRKVLEVGSGFGTSTAILTLLGYDVTAVDINPEMLSHSRRTLKLLGLAQRARFRLGNTFDLSSHYGRYDAVFSAGVLEHFSIDKAVVALKEQAKTAKHVVIAIPTRHLGWREEGFTGYFYPHTPLTFKAMCRKADLDILTFLAFGDPNGRTFALLRNILPYVVWRVLRKRFFAVSVAAICTSSSC